MKLLYFSGFSLHNESVLFEMFLIKNNFCISGFSYGAIKAFEYLCKNDMRIDRLQLFSPAFFLDKDEKYRRLQMMFFQKNPDQYAHRFLKNCGFDDSVYDTYFQLGTKDELQELLEYRWDENKLKALCDRGIIIEVYLGGKDKIIDSNKACGFFKEYAEVYFIKDANHILK